MIPADLIARQFCGGGEMSDRKRDELHLEWLRLADAGVLQREIARRSGVGRSVVSMTLRRIEADLAKSEAGHD